MQWLGQLYKRLADLAKDKRTPVRCHLRASCAHDIAARLVKDFIQQPVDESPKQEQNDDEFWQSGDGTVWHSEPAAEISPEEAAQIQRSCWETSVARFAQYSSTSFASHMHEPSQMEKRIVLLSFNRRPCEFQEAIHSALASTFLGNGIDVRPSWAGGAIVLVEGLGMEDLHDDIGTWNVAVSDVDEPSIFEALQTLPCKIRPRLKPGIGRRLVPCDLDRCDVSDDATDSVQFSTDDQDVDVQSLTEPQELQVCIFRTFIHVRPKPASAASLPNTV
eukprot:TRINITY_DN26561_c0_g1_i1.p2 TRINITY_DN26561_c0_g1~~TRINITY_DN26561_c0_g1_i1.p2  ORF type:complete len:276 (-),score=48.95 TRINITY_DN26561_c0_g1_i1:250-1077(-)